MTRDIPFLILDASFLLSPDTLDQMLKYFIRGIELLIPLMWLMLEYGISTFIISICTLERICQITNVEMWIIIESRGQNFKLLWF